MSDPANRPADAPQTPAPHGKPCKECKGTGNKPGRFLGSPDDPCPACGGSGTIEVVETPLTAWQQEVLDRLTRIEAKLEEMDSGSLLAKGDWA